MPIDDLPNEVLLTIFKILVNSPSPSFSNPPCRIAEVCQLWRAQSLLIPGIRCALPLISFGASSCALQGELKTEREISFAMRNLSNRHKEHPDFLKVLKKSTQWGHAEFLDLHIDILRLISASLFRDVPLLHTLKLNIDVGREDYAGYLYSFDVAPALRRLELECTTNFLFKAPFAQLEEYVERSTSAIGIGRVLHPESKIQSLSYYSFPSAALPLILYPTNEPIPHLTTLNLHLSSMLLDALLSPLVLPALTRLRVVSGTLNQVDNVQGLISRSGSILTTLSLSVDASGIQAMRTIENHASLLHTCLELRNLELDNLDVSLYEEIMDPSSSSFLPHLREFVAHLIQVKAPAHPAHELGLTWTTSTNGVDGQSRRVPFVRLIFPSAKERVVAHKYLQMGSGKPGDTEVDVDERLKQTTQFLAGSLEAIRWWHTFSSSKRPSSKLQSALAFLESDHGAVQDAWQILVRLVQLFGDYRNLTVLSSSAAFISCWTRYCTLRSQHCKLSLREWE